MTHKVLAIGFLLIFLMGVTVIDGKSVEDEPQKPSWLKQPKKIIFLDETEVVGEQPRPTSKFDADHIARTIRPFTVKKDVRAILEHYEPRADMQEKYTPFYDSRMDRRNW